MLSAQQQEIEQAHLSKECNDKKIQNTFTDALLPQQIKDIATTNLVVTFPKTIMSFLNMRMASAPIQNTEARVKYCIRTEDIVQPMLFSVRSTPTVNTSNMSSMAIHI